KLWPRLHVNLVELVEQDEPLFVGAADENVQVLKGPLNRDALLHGHVVVDEQFVLGVVRRIERKEAFELLPLFQARHELLGHFSKPLVVGDAGLRSVEHTQGNTAGGTETGNGGRLEELEL